MADSCRPTEPYRSSERKTGAAPRPAAGDGGSLDRRTLIASLPALLGAGTLLLSCRGDDAREAALQPLVAELEPVGGAAGLGERSLAELRSRRLLPLRGPSRASLARELLPGDEWRKGLPAVRGALAERIRADYDEGRTVDVDGWILSETELHLLAYAALADPAG